VLTLDYSDPPPAAAARFIEMESILRDVLTRARSLGV